MNTKNKGFTLLEILLVIALMGILIGILLVAINPNRQLGQARNLTRKKHITDIYNALELQKVKNKGVILNTITTSYQEICDTGTESSDSTATSCTGKLDLRVLVPTYITSIPRDTQASTGSTGYEVAKTNTNTNQISIRAKNSELGESIVINPKEPTTEELIQTQITAGTLVPTGTQQLVLNRLVYKNNAGTQTYIDPATTTRTCPTGYIAVPGNSMYGTSDFCVMKYEAKAVATSAPTVGLLSPNTGYNTIDNYTTATTSANGRALASVASGYPISNINQTTAIDYCANQNTVSGGSLITNAEWMTIARNIEGVASNWTNNAVGIGGLWRGHSDGSPYNALAASTDDNPYFGTGNDIDNGWQEKRTHTLSNGAVIWDLSGNVWEFVNDTILGQNKPNNSSGGFRQEWTAISNFGTLSYDLTRPSNPAWNSTQNMGQYFAGPVTGTTNFAFLRGGPWGNTTFAGVFNLDLDFTPSSTLSMGFRCVLR